MKVIEATNINDALVQGVELLVKHGMKCDSRNGATLEIQEPVATVFQKPWNHVLLNPARDANPFFHLMEAMWILAGREDVAFVSEFNSNIGNYSDDGIVFNAAYGYRLRNGNYESGFDQLQQAIDILRADPNSRQVVCQIWDENDLDDRETKDKACNLEILFKVRIIDSYPKLCMTVYNRSNDIIWGLYGANTVQFSMIQEYVSAHLGILIGPYTHISDSFHAYTEGKGGEVFQATYKDLYNNKYHDAYAMIPMQRVRLSSTDINQFDLDLRGFFLIYDMDGIEGILNTPHNVWMSNYFKQLVLPMLRIYAMYKAKDITAIPGALVYIIDGYWRTACYIWLNNRGVM